MRRWYNIYYYVSFQNAPKYVTSLNPEDELQIQYEIHSSIDFVEEKLKTGKKDMRDLYLGILYSTEDHKVYPLLFQNCCQKKNA